MRCCSFILFPLVVVAAFVAGLLLRDVPAIDALVLQARRTVAGAAAPPTTVAAPGSSSGPVVQQSGREVTVKVDEATLTQQANANLAGRSIGDTPFGSATVRRLAVHLQNNQIVTDGTAQVGPTVAPVNVTSTVRAEAGRLRVTVTDAKVGGIPLPAGMRQQIESELQAQVDQVMGQQRIQVRSVTIADGALLATGTAA
jgi:hypothetical protein